MTYKPHKNKNKNVNLEYMNRDKYDFTDFYKRIKEQGTDAIKELKTCKKTSHWMWYFFPQLCRKNTSSTSLFYGMKSLSEAKRFLDDPITGNFLLKLTAIVYKCLNTGCALLHIFGKTDRLKFLSCMTLFSYIPKANNIFKECRIFAEKELKGQDLYTIKICETSLNKK